MYSCESSNPRTRLYCSSIWLESRRYTVPEVCRYGNCRQSNRLGWQAHNFFFCARAFLWKAHGFFFAVLQNQFNLWDRSVCFFAVYVDLWAASLSDILRKKIALLTPARPSSITRKEQKLRDNVFRTCLNSQKYAIRKKSLSDITKEQFKHIRAISESGWKKPAPSKVDLYEVFYAIRYLLKTDCNDICCRKRSPKWNAIYYFFVSRRSLLMEKRFLLQQCLKKIDWTGSYKTGVQILQE